MATSNALLNQTLGTAAYMQAWVAWWVSLLTAGGWVQTGDTGQTASGSFGGSSIATSAGYQVWRMADTLQATVPIFVKIEWGGGATTNAGGMWFTIGKATDGAGNITGANLIFARQYVQGYAALGANAPNYGSAGNNRFAVLNFYCASNGAANQADILVTLERTKDGSGADTGDGLLFMFICPGIGMAHAYIPYTGLARGVLAMLPLAIFPTGATTMSDGVGNLLVHPVWYFGQYGAPTCGNNILAYYFTDLPALNTFSVSVRGSNKTYITTSMWNQSGYGLGSWASNNACQMMLYE